MTRGVPARGFRMTKAYLERQATFQGNVVDFKNPNAPEIPEVIESDEEILARITERFEILGEMVDAVSDGICRLLMISSPAGMGKSQLVLDKLHANDPEMETWTIVKGHSRATGLYIKLWENRHPGNVLVFDDCDTIFGDEGALNLLKAAADTQKNRTVSWLSKAELLDKDGEQVPNSFEFEGSIIFITNLAFDLQIEKATKLAPHMQALMSRGSYVDLGMKSRHDCVVWIRHMIKELGLISEYCGPEMHDDVLHFIEKNIKILREVSLRSAIKVAQIRSKNSPRWEAVAKVTTCKV